MSGLRQYAMNQVRDEIIDAAGLEFGRNGYAGTSFSGIASVMGKPKSVIGYHLFPSKRSLAHAVIAEQDERWQAADARIGVPYGALRWVTMILASAQEAQRSPIAMGAIRLLHELPRMDDPVYTVFDWRAYTRTNLRMEAAAHDLDLPDLDGVADVLLDACFGLVTTTVGDDDAAELSERLITLIRPILATVDPAGAAATTAAAAAAHELVAGPAEH
ncbi:TetR/AcrR family transcriptional regulator [Plantibacter sp. VKM Ac-2885]|uniref:TetR/AcrR family transcriptional regulator n=1 Tax=Plantibacter TaxID=190323 RepID=UPI0010C1C634|nr:TetR/AcrR family transcriptional regulator [Plantibacter flavus]MBD8518645.1 TetR/AcrR family transcriptional regulator [Plantibacter sp. CFBP 8804]MBF4511481.1 TetR/AcrR family transcriptional regulator [Plantibacter sp. VKM Ac-2885]TKJ99497.1 TetR/AcrR family transcriptional regulator [Plantibacter flavus]